MKKYYLNEWRLGEKKPRNISIFNSREKGEEEFINLANMHIARGNTITNITHLWNYTFQDKNGDYFNVYMYEATI